MLKKTITYTNYVTEEEVTEDFYFNLSKAEVMELQLGMNGGYSEYLTKIAQSKDVPSIVSTFKSIILKSYGEKSEDGKRFIKSEEISKAFSQTDAYSVLFMELINDANACESFLKGIMPPEAVKALEKKETAPAK